MSKSVTTRAILLVDDGCPLSKVVAALLAGAGFRVLVAGSASTAFKICRQARIVLLMTNLSMPDLPGPQLAMRVVSMCPDVRILYMSGSDEGHLPQTGLSSTGPCLLQKPFSPADLLNAVDGVLESDLPTSAAVPKQASRIRNRFGCRSDRHTKPQMPQMGR
jgi:DNA-binding response OmpR family regulator